jgi:hypothetical protein
MATRLEDYVVLLRKMGRTDEADRLEALAESIRARHAETNPPNQNLIRSFGFT